MYIFIDIMFIYIYVAKYRSITFIANVCRLATSPVPAHTYVPIRPPGLLDM